MRSSIFNFIQSQNGQYRQNDCFELCLQHFIIDQCKCFYSPLAVGKIKCPPCSNQSDCVLETFKNIIPDIGNRCALECPLECDYIKYDLSYSTIAYPTKEYFDGLKNESKTYKNTSFEEFQGTHLYLNLFFASKEYTEIREVPKLTEVDLISLLGGVLGIFLGFSVFSLVELIEILLQIIAFIFRKTEN